MLLIELGYIFGITHKILYNMDWVIWAYVTLFFLVAVDLYLYAINRRREKREK
jgi:membrane protein DedA with SNARE-associated domain